MQSMVFQVGATALVKTGPRLIRAWKEQGLLPQHAFAAATLISATTQAPKDPRRTAGRRNWLEQQQRKLQHCFVAAAAAAVPVAQL